MAQSCTFSRVGQMLSASTSTATQAPIKYVQWCLVHISITSWAFRACHLLGIMGLYVLYAYRFLRVSFEVRVVSPGTRPLYHTFSLLLTHINSHSQPHHCQHIEGHALGSAQDCHLFISNAVIAASTNSGHPAKRASERRQNHVKIGIHNYLYS